MTVETLMLSAIALPFLGALGIYATSAWPNLREAVTLTTAGLLCLIVWKLRPLALASEGGVTVLAEPLPGLSIALSLEPLGMLFALVAGSLWLVTAVYSIGYMRGHGETDQTRFYAAFAVAMGSAMGAAFADNLFTLFLFYELLTLSTYPLVTHAGTPEARRGGRIYLGVLLGTSIGFQLLGIIYTWALAGTLDFREGGILAGHINPGPAIFLYALFLFGVGKAAVMPFHRWLPAAMVAPTPVSALLHAVAVVKAGVFTITKVTVYIFGTDLLLGAGISDWLIYFPAATILIASLVALTRDDLKARLAYSTVSQLSYIVVGAMLADAMGLLGGTLHIAMHAFAKITLFFAAGAIIVAAHKTRISDMGGLGRSMPVTFGAFLIGSLSIIGLPPFGGMWSKWYLGLGAVEAGQWLVLATLMVSSLLNIAYLLPIPIRGFFGRRPEGEAESGWQEAPVTCLIAMGVSSLACVILFVYPDPFFELAAMLAGGE